MSRRALGTLVALVACSTFGAAAPQEARVDQHGDALPKGALARLGTVRFRHDASCVAFSPDGTLLASGGEDNQIRLLDPQSGKVLRVLRGHDRRNYVAKHEEGKADDVLVESVGQGCVTALAFSPDGHRLASGGWDDSVRLWDVATGEELLHVVAHRGMVASVVFSRDGLLATRGGIDGLVKVWDPRSGAELGRVEGVPRVNPWRFNRDAPLAFSPDGKTLAVGDKKVIRFLAVPSVTGESRALAEGGSWNAHPSCLFLAWSHDGTLLASSGVDGEDQHSLRIWDAASGKELRRCKLPKDEPPIHFAFSRDDRHLAAVVEEDELHVFSVATGEVELTLPHYWPSRVAYSPDGSTLVSARGATLRSWDATNGKPRFPELAGHESSVACVAITRDGKQTASGGDGVRIWETASGTLLRTIEPKGSVEALAFSPDGTRLATAGSDKVVRLWSVATGEPAGALEGHKHPLRALAWSEDGTRLASGDTQATLRIWDVASGTEKRAIDVKSLTEKLALAFSPDGKSLACGGAWNDTSFLPAEGIDIQGVSVTPKKGYAVLMWSVDGGGEPRRFEGLNDNVRSVAFARDGTAIAAASRDGRVGVWDAATGAEKLFLLAHPDAGRVDAVDAMTGAYPSLVFAKEGSSVVTAGADGTIRRFDARTGRELARLESDAPITALALAADGNTLVSAGADSSLLVWDLAAAPAPRPKHSSRTILIGD